MPVRSSTSSRDERGAALVLVAVSMVALFAAASLAVDLGLAFTARGEAQRVADAAALAGASAFMDYKPNQAEKHARARAYEYAMKNVVRNAPIDSAQLVVHVLPDSQRVRVWVASQGLPTWFARVLSIPEMQVQAMAAAEASNAGIISRCVLPMAVPDLWDDVDDDVNPMNELPDALEDWAFEPEAGDNYERFDGYPCNELTCDPNGTGLGSNHRNPADGVPGDYGRRIWIKENPPGLEDANLQGMIAPGNFLFWAMPDPAEECQPAGGADWVSWNISNCNPCGVELFRDYVVQTGGIASIRRDIEGLVDQDPNAVWNDTQNRLVSDLGEDSPRVRVIPLWNPEQPLTGASEPIEFNNFAKVFVEGISRDRGIMAVSARFMGMVSGTPSDRGSGTLVKYLRLVE